MIAPARMFSCLSMPFSGIVEQSNPTGTRASVELVMIWYFPNAFAIFAAGAEKTPKPASTRKTPVRTTSTPIKTRGLNRPDCEADFFFMGCGALEHLLCLLGQVP